MSEKVKEAQKVDALTQAMKEIEKKLGAGSIQRGSQVRYTVELFTTGILAFDEALGGGIPGGEEVGPGPAGGAPAQPNPEGGPAGQDPATRAAQGVRDIEQSGQQNAR